MKKRIVDNVAGGRGARAPERDGNGAIKIPSVEDPGLPHLQQRRRLPAHTRGPSGTPRRGRRRTLEDETRCLPQVRVLCQREEGEPVLLCCGPPSANAIPLQTLHELSPPSAIWIQLGENPERNRGLPCRGTQRPTRIPALPWRRKVVAPPSVEEMARDVHVTGELPRPGKKDPRRGRNVRLSIWLLDPLPDLRQALGKMSPGKRENVETVRPFENSSGPLAMRHHDFLLHVPQERLETLGEHFMTRCACLEQEMGRLDVSPGSRVAAVRPVPEPPATSLQLEHAPDAQGEQVVNCRGRERTREFTQVQQRKKSRDCALKRSVRRLQEETQRPR